MAQRKQDLLSKLADRGEDVVGKLSDDQKKKWKDLLGERFEFKMQFPGGPPRGSGTGQPPR